MKYSVDIDFTEDDQQIAESLAVLLDDVLVDIDSEELTERILKAITDLVGHAVHG